MLDRDALHTRLVSELKNLGLSIGDIVLVRGAIKLNDVLLESYQVKIFTFYETLIDALVHVVGPKGTVVTLTFTKQFRMPLNLDDRKYVFDANITKSNAGILPNVFLKKEGAIRSSHPVCSFAAIGSKSQELLSGHTEESHSYKPIKNLVDLGGKMLIFGVIDTSPGFTTVHLAQHNAGLSTKFRGKFGVWYSKQGLTKFFNRKDIGGCSRGFGKFYDVYRRHGLLNEGKLFNQPAMLVAAADAYDVEFRLIRQNNKFPLCADPDCSSCRFMWKYNNWQAFKFVLRYFRLKMFRRFHI